MRSGPCAVVDEPSCSDDNGVGDCAENDARRQQGGPETAHSEQCGTNSCRLGRRAGDNSRSRQPTDRMDAFSTPNLWLVLLLVILGAWCPLTSAIEMDPCKLRSCYPATGNLLIGRGSRLKATSTCGMGQVQRFCIVSHLDDPHKCFDCDSRTPWDAVSNRHSHRVQNIITEDLKQRRERWWQAENGVENVSIWLDLEAEFHFTHLVVWDCPLVITFKTFRPSAMLIERSSDYGSTWKVYRYFAQDCESSFPGVPMGTPKRHSDVVCTDKYSNVAPSSGGEVVLKVLSPHIPVENPYSEETQDLIRVTNLRVNFTKLHTLGDDLLDFRPEIDRKYYYSIYDMVVRGSCSCYGHAEQCIQIDQGHAGGDGLGWAGLRSPDPGANRLDMVHGQCVCQHHTKGRNCEECDDFYNDLPWQPATADDTNECKPCNCNGHARRCHFDRAVYEASGYVTGGVCDDCEHNTMGRNCEQCKPYFYRDMQRPLDDQYVCMPCSCNLKGADNEGLCDPVTDADRGLVAGQCHCKRHVDGDTCNVCKHGYWRLQQDNPDGCQQCDCLTEGTVGNRGCDKETGVCTCKRLVTGEQCDQCLPQHYGLSTEPEGCKPCDCDLGGAYDNDCDVLTGQCACRPNYDGRRCDAPQSGFFCANLDYLTFEAEAANATGPVEMVRRESRQRQDWTGTGVVRARSGAMLTFEIPHIHVAQPYKIVVRYANQLPRPWDDLQVVLVRPRDPDPNGPCADDIRPDSDVLTGSLHPNSRYAEISPAVCLEQGVQYELRLALGGDDRAASILIDSVLLVPPDNALSIFANNTAVVAHHKDLYQRYQCRHQVLSLVPLTEMSETCQRYVCPLAASLVGTGIECDCNPTGSESGICSALGGQCECKQNVVGRTCHECAPGTFGFGPSGCTKCQCNSVGALDNFCHAQTGQCSCREEGIHGRRCDQCQPGFWAFPDCKPCQCNGHADTCDQRTGACIECRDLTSGHTCDRCQDGYYGDPRLGVDKPCRPCPCPGGPGSGKQHADTCYLDPASDSVLCNCHNGYIGARCDQCQVNHWGNPSEIGGSCQPCMCNDNIDPAVADSCDPTTGQCTKCLHNSVGPHCEHCAEGFFGDATRRMCRQCTCNTLGTNSTVGACDRASGQCPCLPNVVGLQCDQCDLHHWRLSSEKGCDPCKCDQDGVRKDEQGEPLLQCNEFDGQCECAEGRGGRACDQCQDYFWGDPTLDQCKRCDCDMRGAATRQCDRETGECVCLAGSGGSQCNQCARGYTGTWPQCEPCGECFDNWDVILTELKNKTDTLVSQANNIEDTGVASVYDEDFAKMEAALGAVKAQLDKANVTEENVQQLQQRIDTLQDSIAKAKERLNAMDTVVTEATAGVDRAEQGVKELKEDVATIKKHADELAENATKLKEADVQGAYNITRDSAARSQEAKRRVSGAEAKVARAEEKRRQASDMYERNQDDFEKQFTENEQELSLISDQLDSVSGTLPDLNEQVCGASALGCDPICGGAKCAACGGPSCDAGAVSMAAQALDFARKTATALDDKQSEAAALQSDTQAALLESEKAKVAADKAYEAALGAARQANATKNELRKTLDQMTAFLEKEKASPAEIRALAEDILAENITLTPDEVRELSGQIRDSLAKLQNIDAILDETSSNVSLAQQLKLDADEAKRRAEAILNTTTGVMDALDMAKRAQDKAQSAVDQASRDIDTAREDLAAISTLTGSAESTASSINDTMSELESQVSAARVDYVKIGRDVDSARKATDKAASKADEARLRQGQLDELYQRAEKALERKDSGNQVPKERAEVLKQRAAALLEKTQKHLRDIASAQVEMDASTISLDQITTELGEKQLLDSNEVRAAGYATTLDQLATRVDAATELIQQRLNFYQTCD